MGTGGRRFWADVWNFCHFGNIVSNKNARCFAFHYGDSAGVRSPKRIGTNRTRVRFGFSPPATVSRKRQRCRTRLLDGPVATVRVPGTISRETGGNHCLTNITSIEVANPYQAIIGACAVKIAVHIPAVDQHLHEARCLRPTALIRFRCGHSRKSDLRATI